MKTRPLKLVALATLAPLLSLSSLSTASITKPHTSGFNFEQSTKFTTLSRQGSLIDLQNPMFLQNSPSFVGRYICPTCD
jgi:uncharacterized membrane protein